jgi:flagellar biosynthesis protein FlhG
MDQAEGLRQRVGVRPPGNRNLRVIAVTSGKGGVGKTNVTTNFAVCAAKLGKRVLIIDGDLGLANVELLLGLTPKYHLGHLLDSELEVKDVIARGPHGIDVLSAGSGVQSLTRLDDLQKLRLTTALDSLEDAYDLVLIDSSAGIGDNVLFFVGAAQQALLVASPEPTSLTDAYATVKALSTLAGVTDFDVVVNQAPSDAHAREIFQRLSSVTARFLSARLRYAGHVPTDESVHRAVMAQRPVCDVFPHAPASRALSQLAGRLLSEPSPSQCGGGLKFLWQRLFRESAQAAG